MKKLIHSIFVTFLLVGLMVWSSCSKSDSLHPYPANLQLASMNVTTINYVTGDTLVENYSFAYDASNRLDSVFYTTDDTTVYDQMSKFVYSNDTIYKYTSYRYTHVSYKETDTFIVSGSNQINQVYTSVLNNSYVYNGKLIATASDAADGNSYTYKSYSGDNLYCILDSNGHNFTTNYVYYSTTNRIGDYLQLNSFATYGYNFYPNAHMINTITSPFGTTTCTYLIDANNVVTETNVVMATGGVTKMTQKYDLSYNNY